MDTHFNTHISIHLGLSLCTYKFLLGVVNVIYIYIYFLMTNIKVCIYKNINILCM